MILIAAMVLIGVAVHRFFVPFGESIDSMIDFHYTSVRSVEVGPDGQQMLCVVKDAGATHSGRHLVWLFRGDSAAFWPIVARGYARSWNPKEFLLWHDNGAASVALADTYDGIDTQRYIRTR